MYFDQLYSDDLAYLNENVGSKGVTDQVIPIPRLTAGDTITVTSPGQFARMAELGLDRYLTFLTDEQRALAELDARSLTVIKGCAGSGKTTIAVHRVRFLADRILRQPQLLGDAPRRVLYLCYNNVLAQVVDRRCLRRSTAAPYPELNYYQHSSRLGQTISRGLGRRCRDHDACD